MYAEYKSTTMEVSMDHISKISRGEAPVFFKEVAVDVSVRLGVI